MWANAATQRNDSQLESDGVIVLDPGTGNQACSETGQAAAEAGATVTLASGPHH
jgi:phosphopantothenoylcysteine synthetase/decarboxylase